MFWLPLLGATSIATVGTYRFTFGVPNQSTMVDLPDVIAPRDFTVETKRATVLKSEKAIVTKAGQTQYKYILTIQLHENPVPFGVIIVAVAGVIGLALIVLTLEKVEKLIDSPTIEVGILLALAAVVLFAIKAIKT